MIRSCLALWDRHLAGSGRFARHLRGQHLAGPRSRRIARFICERHPTAQQLEHHGALVPAVLLAALALSGCNEPPAVNPWRDDSIPECEWTTPSEQGVYAANRQPVLRHRGEEQLDGPMVDPQTPHYPLWWEDPFEDKGDQNDTFAWTWQDYFAGPYSLARFDLNTVAFPVSAVCQPPGTPMVSDGCIGPKRPHDAKKGVSPDPTATATDFTYQHPCEVATADQQEAVPAQTAPAP